MSDTIKFNRAKNLEFISGELEKNVKKHLEEGKILHDATLRFLILDIVNRNKMDIKFVSSDDWIWTINPENHEVRSVLCVLQVSCTKIEKTSKDFVKETNQILSMYPKSNVFNADQNGFQLEMNNARTLDFTGSDNINCVVQNVSSTTNSYTVLPLIAADGTLHPKLFVTLKQEGGKFHKKGHYKTSNLMVTFPSSHIMTKNSMKVLFEKVVFDSSMLKDGLLLVESWSSWKDQSAIDSVKPAALAALGSPYYPSRMHGIGSAV